MTQLPLPPRGIKAPHGATVLEITWADGSVGKLPHSVLRGYCPCAGCQGHSGAVTYKAGGNLELRDIEPVGNYALKLVWADGHDTGLYSFKYLKTLTDLVQQYGVELPVSVPALAKQ